MRVIPALACLFALTSPVLAEDPAAKAPQFGAWKAGERELAGGLTRFASTGETETRNASLSIGHLSAKPCPAGAKLDFTFDTGRTDKAYEPKGKAGARRLTLYATLERGGGFESKARALSLAYDEGESNFTFAFDPAAWASATAVALCPADPKGKPGAACHRFSLDGFAEARRFVCGAP